MRNFYYTYTPKRCPVSSIRLGCDVVEGVLSGITPAVPALLATFPGLGRGYRHYPGLERLEV